MSDPLLSSPKFRLTAGTGASAATGKQESGKEVYKDLTARLKSSLEKRKKKTLDEVAGLHILSTAWLDVRNLDG